MAAVMSVDADHTGRTHDGQETAGQGLARHFLQHGHLWRRPSLGRKTGSVASV